MFSNAVTSFSDELSPLNFIHFQQTITNTTKPKTAPMTEAESPPDFAACVKNMWLQSRQLKSHLEQRRETLQPECNQDMSTMVSRCPRSGSRPTYQHDLNIASDASCLATRNLRCQPGIVRLDPPRIQAPRAAERPRRGHDAAARERVRHHARNAAQRSRPPGRLATSPTAIRGHAHGRSLPAVGRSGVSKPVCGR
jgi:hypothetical protein